jgi:hypothetical protein
VGGESGALVLLSTWNAECEKGGLKKSFQAFERKPHPTGYLAFD